VREMTRDELYENNGGSVVFTLGLAKLAVKTITTAAATPLGQKIISYGKRAAIFEVCRRYTNWANNNN